MRAAALSLLLALPASADEVATLAKCLEPSQRMALAQRLTALEAENADLRKKVSETTPAWVSVVVGLAALVATGASVGVAVAAAKR